ncbi:MAG: hypothetical protein AB7S56_01405 [Halothiobacillaceae bacterium]
MIFDTVLLRRRYGLGVSLYISTFVFSAVLATILFIWYRIERTLSIHDIVTHRRELSY